MTEKRVVVTLEMMERQAKQVKQIDEIITKRIEAKEKVCLNLYFGTHKRREKADDKLFLPDGSYRFQNWK